MINGRPSLPEIRKHFLFPKWVICPLPIQVQDKESLEPNPIESPLGKANRIPLLVGILVKKEEPVPRNLRRREKPYVAMDKMVTMVVVIMTWD